jgi:hypothetical protein
MITKNAISEKLNTLEAEIKFLRKAVTERPSFDIDEANWKKMKPALKKARTRAYKKIYG